MDYKSKYLKYKSKYLQLLSQSGGTQEGKKSSIIHGYVNLVNKGTHNCGVYYKYKEPHKIMLCNRIKISTEALEFLHLNNINNLKVYPKFYQLYHSTDTDEYFYLWEKMDGDLRDFFLKHIPSRMLKRHYPDLGEEAIKVFIDFIYYKSFPNKLYIIKNKDFNTNEYKLLGEYDDLKLVYNKTIPNDEKNIKIKLNLIKSYNNLLNHISFGEVMRDIIDEVEKQLSDIIISLTKKRYTLYKNNFSSTDKKFDNIVYKIIEQNGDNYKYEFYFIDPESTLSKFGKYTNPETELADIINDLKNKFNVFKVLDAIPNIYDMFLTSMFNINDIYNTHKFHIDLLFVDYLLKEGNKTEFEEGEVKIPKNSRLVNGWDAATKEIKININNVLPIKVNTEKELLKFINYSI